MTESTEVLAPEEKPAPVLYKFTNRPDSPELDSMLAMFYQGVQANLIGIMQAYNLDTEEEEIILIGVELDENGLPNCFPLAKALTSKEVHRYLSPDGLGGFYDPHDPIENEAVKDRMKPYHEAVEEKEVTIQ